MERFSLVLFIGINTAFASLDSCVYEPPKCTPLTTVDLEDGTSVSLVKKWVLGPRTNSFAATFCRRPIQNGFYICRRPDCSSTPCLHGSTCMETKSSYRCNCALGYYGSNCQHAALTRPQSSMGSTMMPTFSTVNSSTSATPLWTSLTTYTIAATTNDVTPDVPTTSMTSTPLQASTKGESSSAPPSYQGKQYGVPSPVTEKTFENAKQDCIAIGPASSDSSLIELTDEQEKAHIIGYVSGTSIPARSSLWIGCPKYLSGDPEHGFYCFHSEYRYSSVHNIDIGYWDWDSGEPQKSGRRCMVLNLETQKYRAEYCESAVAFALCEWNSS